MIAFIAIPHPIPSPQREALIEAGQKAISARKALEVAKESEIKSRINLATHELQNAVDLIESIEGSIRNTIGVVHSRNEYKLGGVDK